MRLITEQMLHNLAENFCQDIKLLDNYECEICDYVNDDLEDIYLAFSIAWNNTDVSRVIELQGDLENVYKRLAILSGLAFTLAAIHGEQEKKAFTQLANIAKHADWSSIYGRVNA